jgi:hypothetical protein
MRVAVMLNEKLLIQLVRLLYWPNAGGFIKRDEVKMVFPSIKILFKYKVYFFTQPGGLCVLIIWCFRIFIWLS